MVPTSIAGEAGLEGSGHHALGPFFNSSGQARPFSTVGRRKQDAVDVAFLDLTLFGENSTEEYNTIKIAQQRVKALFREWHNSFVGTGPGASNDSTMVLLNTLAGERMMSYPTGNGPMKVLMTPDIRILAKLAEEAGVDLRVIVLSRGYGDIFRSTRIHRHFGSNDVVQTKDLTVNAAMLASQVQLIDPAFVMCVRYNDLGDLGWWQKPSNGAVGGKGLTHAHWLLNPPNNAGWINRAVKAIAVHPAAAAEEKGGGEVGIPGMQQLGAAVSLVDRVARYSEDP